MEPCPQCYHEIIPEDDRCNCEEVKLRDEIDRLNAQVKELSEAYMKAIGPITPA